MDAFRLLDRFPIKLGFQNYDRKRESDNADIKDRIVDDNVKRENNGGDRFVESFVNWPNFVSGSRMASGPVLGW